MAEITLQILSDLHLESPAAYDVYEIDAKAPILALLGDIGYVKDDGFFDFLHKQLSSFEIVLLVLGNHETLLAIHTVSILPAAARLLSFTRQE